MGKCGGHELNYVSDVDVIFVAEPADGVEEHVALRTATRLASHLIRICGDPTAEGAIWPVDAALRPEGKSGPLVRTLASHEGYYRKWAKTWEFQALLKARPVAGDAALGQAYMERITPMVWSASQRDGFVTEVQAMRRRVLEHIPRRAGRPADQARRRRAARRRVRRPAAPDGARPRRRGGPGADDAVRAGLPHPGRVRRPRGRCRAGPRLPVPAHPRAPDAALPAHPHPRRARGRGVAAAAGPVDGDDPGARRGAAGGVAPAQPRGAPAAREALLPPAAGRGRQAAHRRGAALPGVGAAAARRRSATRTRWPRCGTSRR